MQFHDATSIRRRQHCAIVGLIDHMDPIQKSIPPVASVSVRGCKGADHAERQPQRAAHEREHLAGLWLRRGRFAPLLVCPVDPAKRAPTPSPK